MSDSTRTHSPSRRGFLTHMLAAGAAVGGASWLPSRSIAEDNDTGGKQPFKISLAQWSLHKTLFGGKLDNLDFAKTAKQEFGIEGVEYVNQFFMDKAKDQNYLADMKQRAEDNGVTSVLIMVDGEGNLGEPTEADRKKTVDNHKKWVEAAKFLGCHSVRVNAGSRGTYEEQQQRAADGLRMLCEFAQPHGLNIIVENHGGLSSNGQWLAGTIKMVDMENCGTLPDFGNFRVGGENDATYDRYKGVEELMPYAKAVSAKTFAFDEEGNESTMDYPRLMKIVLDHGYDSWVGIEWEGAKPDEYEGIRLSKALLEKIAAEVQ